MTATIVDLTEKNREAWNRRVAQGDRWTLAVTADAIAAARRGNWSVVLTPVKPVPREWLEPLDGKALLGLASAGGQQGPILAAAGADVTILDNADAQLAQDRLVADREGLSLTTVQGDMRDLSMFADASFDCVFNPVSVCFVPDVLPVWRECFRVLRPGGTLLSGFGNPVLYIFDAEAYERRELSLEHRIPYSDLETLSDETLDARVARGEPIEFGHTLGDLIGGQIAAGFEVIGFYEDDESADPSQHVVSRHLPCFIATRARKPR